MKKIVSLTMTMVLSAMTVMAISPYKLEKIAGHHVLKSTGEQAVVLACLPSSIRTRTLATCRPRCARYWTPTSA